MKKGAGRFVWKKRKEVKIIAKPEQVDTFDVDAWHRVVASRRNITPVEPRQEGK